MKHKYVIIDSSKENHNSVDAKFKVQIPQGITGTTRVCVKSFSMPNSYHNIYGDLKTAKFVEFYRPTPESDWVYEAAAGDRIHDASRATAAPSVCLRGNAVDSACQTSIREAFGLRIDVELQVKRAARHA